MMGRGAVNTGNSPLLAFAFLSDLEADFCLSEQISGFVAVPEIALTASHEVCFTFRGDGVDFPHTKSGNLVMPCQLTSE